MEGKEVKTRLSQAYEQLQALDIRPTKTNLSILAVTYSAMEHAFAYISEIEAKTEEIKPEEETGQGGAEDA